MSQATLASIAAAVPHTDRFFIGGEWTQPSSDAQLRIVSPATQEVFLSVAEAQLPDLNAAVAAARKAFDHGPWSRMSHAERAAYLRAIGREVEKRAELLGDVWSAEVGCPNTVARGFMASVRPVFDYYAGLANSFPFIERHVPQLGDTAFLVHEPVGVVAAIVPWNGPIGLIYKIAPALLAGCTIVVKSAPQTPSTAYILADAFAAAGLPPGVVNVLTAQNEVSEALVRHAGIDKVAFTGSNPVGKRIAALCSERLARCTLELGGKSAALVLDDFDVEEAARAIAPAAIWLSGQVCSSLTRLIISRPLQQDFADALRAQFAAVRVGDPFDPATAMGPLAMERQRARVESYVSKGVTEGARLVCGGTRPAHLSRGYYLEPTIFCDVGNEMTIAREEIFGPVVSIIPARDQADAVRIANDTVYGLNGSVFTNDVDLAFSIARQIRAGTVGHNGFRTDFSIAFGGFKQSGIGREGGVEGLRAYLEAKTIVLNGEPARTANLPPRTTAATR